MHTRGKDMDLIAHYPNGESQSLINIPKYDFDWQLFYYPQKPVPLPAGTRLDILAHYDNSELNPDNPDPTKDVTFGTQTNDEMMFNVFEFVADVGVSPKPASDETRRDALVSSLPAGSTFSVDLPPNQPTAAEDVGERRAPDRAPSPERRRRHVVHPDAGEPPGPPRREPHLGRQRLPLRYDAASPWNERAQR